MVGWLGTHVFDGPISVCHATMTKSWPDGQIGGKGQIWVSNEIEYNIHKSNMHHKNVLNGILHGVNE